MAVPKSVIKISKNGVELISNVDQASYTLNELTRAALRDVGKFVCRETRKQIKRRSGRVAKNTQYWVRKQETDLMVGFKPGGWYGGYQELGTEKQPKVGALFNSVQDNIPMIIQIESQYLSALSDQQPDLSQIDEGEVIGEGE